MNKSIFVCLLAIGCAPDLRGATVQVGNNVDMDAAFEAVNKLNILTENDTNLEIGICGDGDDCIRLNYSEAVVRANGTTERVPPWERVMDVTIYSKGNTARVIAHELLHAIGLREHIKAPYVDELDLMNDEAWSYMPGRFGVGTAKLYNEEFGTNVKPDCDSKYIFSGARVNVED